jgi:hypothetical protein
MCRIVRFERPSSVASITVAPSICNAAPRMASVEPGSYSRGVACAACGGKRTIAPPLSSTPRTSPLGPCKVLWTVSALSTGRVSSSSCRVVLPAVTFLLRLRRRSSIVNAGAIRSLDGNTGDYAGRSRLHAVERDALTGFETGQHLLRQVRREMSLRAVGAASGGRRSTVLSVGHEMNTKAVPAQRRLKNRAFSQTARLRMSVSMTAGVRWQDVEPAHPMELKLGAINPSARSARCAGEGFSERASPRPPGYRPFRGLERRSRRHPMECRAGAARLLSGWRCKLASRCWLAGRRSQGCRARVDNTRPTPSNLSAVRARSYPGIPSASSSVEAASTRSATLSNSALPAPRTRASTAADSIP